MYYETETLRDRSGKLLYPNNHVYLEDSGTDYVGYNVEVNICEE